MECVSTGMVDPTPNVRRLAAAVILRALTDARAGDKEALQWLGSRGAERYFDLLGVPQSNFLLKVGWVGLAKHSTHPLQRSVQTTLEHLESLSSHD